MKVKTLVRGRQALLLCLTALLVACSGELPMTAVSESEAIDADYPRGPNNGRLLTDGDFAVELAIFETGVPPEFHAWVTRGGSQVALSEVNLRVTLTRLGNEINLIDFASVGDYLRGNTVIYEPHSFSVDVEAHYQGASHLWRYDSFEGRTSIAPELSRALGLETAIAGPAVLEQQVEVFGSIVANSDYSRSLHARFDGLVKEVHVTMGERVTEGQPLLVIESDESFRPYTLNAPISGLITRRNVNPGEQSDGRLLLEIVDPSQVWAELAIFPLARSQVQVGAKVSITPVGGGEPVMGTIASFAPAVGADQSLKARVRLLNTEGRFAPGTFVGASINTGEIQVPLAVRREALQPFRDFTVVFARIGDEYEVRMLELGRQDADLIEVLGGLDTGTEYVTANSYIIKADVEKSGASHDH